MKIYKTREDAAKAAIEEHGSLPVEMGVINVIFISPMIARYLGTEVGYSYE